MLEAGLVALVVLLNESNVIRHIDQLYYTEQGRLRAWRRVLLGA